MMEQMPLFFLQFPIFDLATLLLCFLQMEKVHNRSQEIKQFYQGGLQRKSLHMGPYRTQRIEQLLKETEKVDIERFKRIQQDLTSVQAQTYMEIMKPILSPDSPAEKILLEWDCLYNKDSKGAYLFEKFYYLLLEDVFADYTGSVQWKSLINKIVTPFFHLFDNLVFEYSADNNDILWHNETREQLFRRVLNKAHEINGDKIMTYGESRMVVMANSFFGGNLGKIGLFLGIDYGPFPFEGNRATVWQGQIWETEGRKEAFAPSWRMITDIGSNIVESILPGGPSGRIYSSLYTNEVEMWRNGQYKKFKLE